VIDLEILKPVQDIIKQETQKQIDQMSKFEKAAEKSSANSSTTTRVYEVPKANTAPKKEVIHRSVFDKLESTISANNDMKGDAFAYGSYDMLSNIHGFEGIDSGDDEDMEQRTISHTNALERSDKELVM
jgi:hypothetical protein